MSDAPSESRLDDLTSWHADWKGLRVAVLGLSVTGFSVADTLAELGADVLVVTEKADEEYERLLPVIGARLWTGPLDAGARRSSSTSRPRSSSRRPGSRRSIRSSNGLAETGVAAVGRHRARLARARQGRAGRWHRPPTGCSSPARTARPPPRGSPRRCSSRAACVRPRSATSARPCSTRCATRAGFDALVVELSSHQLWYLGLQSGP